MGGQIFALLFPSPAPSFGSFFLSLWCLYLVVFLKAWTRKCARLDSRAVVCETPAACRPPVTFKRQPSKRPPNERQKNTRRPPEREKKRHETTPLERKKTGKDRQRDREKKNQNWKREREKKKREILGGPTEGGPVVWPNSVGA